MGRRASEDGDDGAAYRRQAWLRWAVWDSFFPARFGEAAALQAGAGDHRHQRVSMQPILRALQCPLSVDICRGLLGRKQPLERPAPVFAVACEQLEQFFSMCSSPRTCRLAALAGSAPFWRTSCNPRGRPLGEARERLRQQKNRSSTNGKYPRTLPRPARLNARMHRPPADAWSSMLDRPNSR